MKRLISNQKHQTHTNMNDMINMDSTIAGSMNARSYLTTIYEGAIAGSMNARS